MHKSIDCDTFYPDKLILLVPDPTKKKIKFLESTHITRVLINA